MVVLKIQICSGKNQKKLRKEKLWRVVMRYVPIYLRQGLVVSSLMSGTFLLLCLPLLGSSWRIGEDELVTLRHTFFARLFLDRVVVGPCGGDSGASQSACPS